MKMFDGQVSINKADNSPFWMVSFRSADGKQKRRSTKVPVAGGLFQGKRHSLHSKSFHSIRATAATFLQSAGVAQGMAIKLVGHDSESIHEVYVKPDAELLRRAAEVLPEI